VASLQANNLKQSMSRRGNCHDKGVAESFFASIKKRRNSAEDIFN
jgi:putative transposase